MADETPKPVAPLGAQIFRKLHGGLSALGTEVTKMAAGLDECDAKAAITGMLGGLGGHVGDIEKNWGKFYKELDLAEQAAEEEVETEAKAADTDDVDDDDDVEAVLNALGDLGDDDEESDEDDDLTPEQKALVERHIKRLETELRHEERLERLGK